ncbi:undecaprenyl-phosphate glucose phosphotransferase [Flavobacterium sp. 7A]|uniref:undecaprenyl-phosphate glucose phosphotransferase n=1 Tax=Flavobacterium sp. 7A TaxID=2940571 RepID=UPI002226684B|nr:undecaprenyl-phosphate glucose phosphotransferase [Flavobacterium sp. 7A]MCW2117959.1 putative colanic acid biosynthesis UDP-glucose lipid carrier transferase [Flavobacterium sp. 7A]
MKYTRIGRYSKYIRPISIIIDLLIIVILSLLLFNGLSFNTSNYVIYLLFSWCIVAFFSKFYQVYRFTTQIEIFSKITKQQVVFLLLAVVYFPFIANQAFNQWIIIEFFILSTLSVALAKFVLFFLLREYRLITGSNYRRTVIIGYSSQAIKLKKLFDTNVNYGYHFLGFFSDKKVNEEIIGNYDDVKEFVLKNNVDEVYCSLSDISNEKMKNLVEFMSENNRNLKFIPDTKDIFSKNLKMEYYELFPVLSLTKSVLNQPEIQFVKRCFDIAFSLLVIVFILSWAVPLIGLLIKLESKGPVLFKQGRPGINQEEFCCYKFRSMVMNQSTEHETIKNDPRITKIGQFLRKTSLDEMPQFFNVLLGDMSIVGPRPQLWVHNNAYRNKIKKYFVRHSVKPGITGLAQISGFRGEINNEKDMENRIKYDVFYIENWSLYLDVKIIFQTVIDIFVGDEKAF